MNMESACAYDLAGQSRRPVGPAARGHKSRHIRRAKLLVFTGSSLARCYFEFCCIIEFILRSAPVPVGDRQIGQLSSHGKNRWGFFACLHLFLFRFLQVRKMLPRKTRQRAGAMNYLKRKDVEEGARGDGGLRAAEERVEGSVGHGLESEERVVVEEMEVRDDGGSGTLEERVEEREEVRDDGGSGTLEERLEEREEVRDDGGS